jgi:AmpE protein
MNLIALLIGLAIERLATQLFHWRRMRWLERIIDAGFERAMHDSAWPPLLVVLGLVALLVLPVLVVTFALGDSLLGFPYLVLAIVVLFFSLGPKDIGEAVDEYCAALVDGDGEDIRRNAAGLLDGEVIEEPRERMHAVESAVFIQANNRLFAVIFWFIALGPFGPLGAWTYRVTDLIRRRAVFNAGRATDDDRAALDALRDVATTVHGWLAWIPARLTALGYAVAGHFDEALRAWRNQPETASTPSRATELLLARVGTGAMALAEMPDEDLVERSVRGATSAKNLVYRLLLIWAVVIAALTLYGWSA